MKYRLLLLAAILIAITAWLLLPNDDEFQLDPPTSSATITEDYSIPADKAETSFEALNVSNTESTSKTVTGKRKCLPSQKPPAVAHKAFQMPPFTSNEVFEKRFIDSDNDSGLQGMSIFQANEVIEDCYEWRKQLDTALYEQASHHPMRQQDLQSIQTQLNHCKAFELRAKKHTHNTREPDETPESSLSKHRAIILPIEQDGWQSVFQKLESGELDIHYTMAFNNGLKVPSSRLSSYLRNPTFEASEQDVIRMIDLGAPFTQSDIVSSLLGIHNGLTQKINLTIINALYDHGTNFGGVFNTRTAMDYMLNHPKIYAKSLEWFRQRYDFDPNLIYYGQEDTLSKALRSVKKLKNQNKEYDYSIVQYLLDQGAFVWQKHLTIDTDEETQALLTPLLCEEIVLE